VGIGVPSSPQIWHFSSIGALKSLGAMLFRQPFEPVTLGRRGDKRIFEKSFGNIFWKTIMITNNTLNFWDYL
jgi:hypothetical protein